MAHIIAQPCIGTLKVTVDGGAPVSVAPAPNRAAVVVAAGLPAGRHTALIEAAAGSAGIAAISVRPARARWPLAVAGGLGAVLFFWLLLRNLTRVRRARRTMTPLAGEEI